jgi:hypothetical protein
MNTGQTIECTIRFTRQAQSRRAITTEASEPLPPVGRLPRVTRLLALAHRFDQYLREGVVATQSELAELGHVSAARIAQIMNLLNLAPDIQEQVLFLEPTRGRAKLTIHDLQPIASVLDWNEQRRLWIACRKA